MTNDDKANGSKTEDSSTKEESKTIKIDSEGEINYISIKNPFFLGR